MAGSRKEERLHVLEIIGEDFYSCHWQSHPDSPNIPSCSIRYSEHIKRNPSRMQEEQPDDNPIIRSAKALLE